MKLVPWVRESEAPARTNPDLVFSRLLEDFFNDWPWRGSMRDDVWRPSVDILEKDGNILLRAEIPGVSEKDIDLKIEGNVLTLRGERKFNEREDRNSYHRMETYYGSFARSFTLPEGVDRDKIKADYSNGILHITIPQKPEVKPRQIPVSVN